MPHSPTTHPTVTLSYIQIFSKMRNKWAYLIQEFTLCLLLLHTCHFDSAFFIVILTPACFHNAPWKNVILVHAHFFRIPLEDRNLFSCMHISTLPLGNYSSHAWAFSQCFLRICVPRQALSGYSHLGKPFCPNTHKHAQFVTHAWQKQKVYEYWQVFLYDP